MRRSSSFPSDSLPAEVAACAAQIAQDLVKYKIVTPGALMNVLQHRLSPLLNDEQKAPLFFKSRPTWRDLFGLYSTYLFMGVDIDPRMQPVGWVIRHFTSVCAGKEPSSRADLPVEVFSFLLMRDQLKQSARVICGDDGEGDVWLYRFCKYCWRRRIPGGKLCYEHSTNTLEPKALAQYQQAKRQSKAFHSQINSMLGVEVYAFHDKGMSRDSLNWHGDTYNWTQKNRPNVFDFLELAPSDASDEVKLLEKVVRLLNPLTPSSPSTKAEQITVNEIFIRQPDLLWPLLIRAEAWLEVRNKTRSSWGGVRAGSGRPSNWK